MTTRADILSSIATLLAANGIGGISAADLQSVLNDLTNAARMAEDPVSGGETVCNFRLTLQSGVPISITDQLAKATLYATPLRGNKIGLYAGGSWAVLSSAELSLDISAYTAGKPYDIFAYNNAGVVAIESLVWTNDTARATALALQDGIAVKSGDATRRYLGTIYTSAAGKCEDSLAKRFVWNNYNRVLRPMKVIEATNSWTYNGGGGPGAGIRQANGSAANQLDYVCWFAEDAVAVRILATGNLNSAALSGASVGVGVDSTTTLSGLMVGQNVLSGDNVMSASYAGIPGLGRHVLSWNEAVDGGTGSYKFYGDNGKSYLQSGITGEVMA